MYKIKANDKKHKKHQKLNKNPNNPNNPNNENNEKNENIVNNVINIIKNRNFKYIDLSHMKIPELIKFTCIDLKDQKNVIGIFKNYKQSDNTKLLFNINTQNKADNNITLYHMYDYLTIPLDNISDNKINKWLDETLESGSKLFYTCNICFEEIESTNKCPECFNDICYKCVMNNFEKNNNSLCPFCKSHNFKIGTFDINTLSLEDILSLKKDQISFI